MYIKGERHRKLATLKKLGHDTYFGPHISNYMLNVLMHALEKKTV